MGLESTRLEHCSRAFFTYLGLSPAISGPDSRTAIDSAKLGLVESENVSFRYDEDSVVENTADEESSGLADINFRIEPGEYVALLGPSGAGKTTITSLFSSFFDVSLEVVKFAVDVTDCDRDELIGHIGILSQDTFLLNNTIAESIAYAKEGATPEQIEEAACLADTHNTILSFRNGYNTLVGEWGYRLGGGEKRRPIMARVPLKDPQVLTLDEATGSLDTRSERLVQAALDSASADRIMVVSAGRIVESGTHTELPEKQGLYAALLTE